MNIRLIKVASMKLKMAMLLLIAIAMAPGVVFASESSSDVTTLLRKQSVESGYTLWNGAETFGLGIQPHGIVKKNTTKVRTRLSVKHVKNTEKYPTDLEMIGDAYRYKIGVGKAKRTRLTKKVWVTMAYPATHAGTDKHLRYWHSTQQKWKKLRTTDNTDSLRVSARMKHKSAVVAVFAKPKQYQDVGSGKASWYDGVGAAHNDVPIGSTIRVTNLANGKSVETVVVGTGPFVPGRVVDLDREGFSAIADLSTGVIDVTVELVQ